ncbi:hypothetical protein D9756_007842 [Leucocoprinus leucothites]|uniref:Protein kinase domain-containing protein n=1 Tax=Leucocoprinus leucothites TaxID=201217 RepID=A0A8H5FYA0_9AGAR|nr:hypothetical protein D9756_007842 [Leucoagaricus leucothites]
MNPISRPRIPNEIPKDRCENLTGLVTRVPNANPTFSGGYADVYIGYYAKDSNTNIKVAIKVLRLIKDDPRIQKVKTHLIRETVVWTSLNHPNILGFFGLADDVGRHGCPALISPFCDNGVVMSYLKTHPDHNTRLRMMAGIADGLQYLHSLEEKIIHGDLKPTNILVSHSGRPLLCDFGRSQITTHAGFTTRASGAVRYQAPELFVNADTKYDEAVDVYAFGITCTEIWTDTMPYPDLKIDPAVVIHVHLGGARPPCPTPATEMTKLLWTCFERCWKQAPRERLSMDGIVQFFRGIGNPSQ